MVQFDFFFVVWFGMYLNLNLFNIIFVSDNKQSSLAS